jgi:hypothetical protein
MSITRSGVKTFTECCHQVTQPPRAWEGVLDASEPGPPCIQLFGSVIGSEDCLYLNVFTPQVSSVLSFITFKAWDHDSQPYIKAVCLNYCCICCPGRCNLWNIFSLLGFNVSSYMSRLEIMLYNDLFYIHTLCFTAVVLKLWGATPPGARGA